MVLAGESYYFIAAKDIGNFGNDLSGVKKENKYSFYFKEKDMRLEMNNWMDINMFNSI